MGSYSLEYEFVSIEQQNSMVSMSRNSALKIFTAEYTNYQVKQIKSEKKRTYIKYKHSCLCIYTIYPLIHKHITHVSSGYNIIVESIESVLHDNLAIEKGWYTRPTTPVEKRTCAQCPMKTEDECHLLVRCTAYQRHRGLLLEHIYSISPQATYLNIINKSVYMMSVWRPYYKTRGLACFRLP